MTVCRWLVGFGGLERIGCGPGKAIPLLLRDGAGDDSLLETPGEPPLWPLPSPPPPSTGREITPLASLSLMVPLKTRDAGRWVRLSAKEKNKTTTIANSCATADRNRPRTGSPWLT